MDVFGEGKDSAKLIKMMVLKKDSSLHSPLRAAVKHTFTKRQRRQRSSKAKIVTAGMKGRQLWVDSATGDEYRITSGAVMYEMDGNDIDGTIRLTRIADKDEDGNPVGIVAMLYDTKKEK